MTGDARRKRRRRGKRADEPRSPAVSPPAPAPAPEAPWQWRTFPVGFAFALGALLMGMLTWIAPGAFYIFVISAFFLSVFGLAHYFGRALRDYRSADDADET